MSRALRDLHSSGLLHEAWLGDPASQQMADHYNDVAITGPNSGLQALTDYQAELQRIADALHQTALAYAATETTNTDSLRGAH